MSRDDEKEDLRCRVSGVRFTQALNPDEGRAEAKLENTHQEARREEFLNNNSEHSASLKH